MTWSLFVLIPAALASTPDGSSPAQESVCDDYSGASHGLCVAYCEATDCDGDNASADPAACDQLASLFEARTGESPPCETQTYEVRVIYTGDDSVTAYLDGVDFARTAADDAWSSETIQTLSLSSGDHTFAFHVWDVAQVAVGLAVVLEVGGTVYQTSADGSFLSTDTDPGPGWADPGFVDTGWSSPVDCQYLPWNSAGLANIDAAGQPWVWVGTGIAGLTCLYTSDLDEGWFRTTLTLP